MMTATPFTMPGGTGSKFQKIVVQLQDNGGNDYDSGNPLPVKIIL